ncbi:MAG TPA: hypothetical protein VFE03_14795 [Caulobacteraceae bacterium]|jgi:hypothetical protein|nr:hypothetical protein [Caulobacteraceae bacterium]
MHRSIPVIAALVLSAGAAHAASETVSLVGKDRATIHADIKRAAKRVCAAEIDASAFYYDVLNACIHDTVIATEAKVADVLAKAEPAKPASARAITAAEN